MRCPACAGRLVEVERSDVMIDACPQCRGVWLDRGELDRLLARERESLLGGGDPDEDFLAEMEGRRAPVPRRAGASTRAPDGEPPYDASRPSGKRRRRRGLLEDLFDFDL